LLTSAQTKLLGLLSPLTEFGAVARTYPVACSGVRQRNFDLGFFRKKPAVDNNHHMFALNFGKNMKMEQLSKKYLI